ncbi:hypothetical protein ABZW18_25790 [Streptomyces sp. NPDC004647]|uniref:thioesterase family protein n=1 Tax=Streptomyces sp. NPDC004647 TaxID=3154671 RepID=UPI0033AF026D
MRALKDGAEADLTHIVRAQDSATNWGNDLPVLATPVLLWLGEVAAMRVLEGALEDGEMTVGYAHTDARHLAATPEGWTVTVQATLTHVDGTMLHFFVEATDARDVVFRGTHIRALINQQRFVERFDRKVEGGELQGVRQ